MSGASNRRQVTEQQLAQFQEALIEFDQTEGQDPNMHPDLRKAIRDSLVSIIEDLQRDLLPE